MNIRYLIVVVLLIASFVWVNTRMAKLASTVRAQNIKLALLEDEMDKQSSQLEDLAGTMEGSEQELSELGDVVIALTQVEIDKNSKRAR